VRATRKTHDALDATSRDIANRTSGTVAAARGRWTDERVDDRRLLERVPAKLGRACSHPHAIDADVAEGAVTLRGPILANEVENVLATVRSVRGVQNVTNALDTNDSAKAYRRYKAKGASRIPNSISCNETGLQRRKHW
jgi:osmotically-inducible protein OsmY